MTESLCRAMFTMRSKWSQKNQNFVRSMDKMLGSVILALRFHRSVFRCVMKRAERQKRGQDDHSAYYRHVFHAASRVCGLAVDISHPTAVRGNWHEVSVS